MSDIQGGLRAAFYLTYLYTVTLIAMLLVRSG